MATVGISVAHELSLRKEPKFYCIRHAESSYNVVESQVLSTEASLAIIDADPTYIDPDITDTGRLQIEAARPYVHSLQIDRVYVSPLKRALKTCKLLFQNHPASPPVVVLPEITEHLTCADAFSRNFEAADSEFPDFDWSELSVSSGYWLFDLVDNETTRQIRQAADKPNWLEVGCSFVPLGEIESLEELRKRCEKATARFREDMSQGLNITIVSHWEFIRQLTLLPDGEFLDFGNVEVEDLTTYIERRGTSRGL
jgi:broad specificity phosphatase PhoE